MPTLATWAGRSRFSYDGSVKEGTVITYGRVTPSLCQLLRMSPC